jgi:hypothetical protein
MTVTVTHSKISSIPDGADTTVVRPSDWNASHTLVGLGTAAELNAGVANGVATLNADGQVPSSQLSGLVTSVTGTAPVVSSGGATPAISMAVANTSTNGYLTSTDWNTFNGKQTSFGSQTANYVYAAPNGSSGNPTFRAIVPQDLGTGSPSSSNYLRGDGTWQSVSSAPAGSNTQVQFNNSGAFGAASTFTWNGSSLSVPALAATTSVTTPLLQSSASNLVITASTGIVDASANTGALKIPIGTTAQRPTGATGMIRQNSTTGNPEWWDATTSTWLQFSQAAGYSVNYLVVAGGGGGGSNGGGGGGAGGLLTSSATFSSGTAYTITVGAGGAGGPNNGSGGNNQGVVGSNSVISTIATSLGGGYGGGGYGVVATVGGSGSSGGGGGGNSSTLAPLGGAGTSGQGFAGGQANISASAYGAGGGGGASAVGSNGSSSAGGNAGNGVSSSISGSTVTYAGGGGGGSDSGTGGTGGSGGGGNGSASGNGVAGTSNTGGGGGGGYGSATAVSVGGAGGSGVVIISYFGSQRGTGGTITSSGGYTIHTFTSSGTYNA